MQAIILAAGMGNRLGELTIDRPKGMVCINEHELIRYVLSYMEHPDIDDITVVTGFERDIIEDFIKENYPDVNLVCNMDYEAGNIMSLAAAMPHITDDFLLMNADHIYPLKMLRHILKNMNGITAICDFDRELSDDDMKVKLNDEGALLRIDKKLQDYDCGYIGMTMCTRDHLNIYREAFDSVLRDIGDNACVENILGWLGDHSAEVNICDASGMPWLEVDTPEDLEHAERTLRENMDFLS